MLRLASPVVLTQLAQMSLGLTDTIMVGRLGAIELASVALGNAVFFAAMIFGMGMLTAVSPMVSQAFGSGNNKDIGRALRQGLWLSLLLSLPIFVMMRLAFAPLLWMGQDPETVAAAQSYLDAISWGAFPFLAYIAIRSFAEGVGKPRPAMIVAFAGLAANILANYVLMFGKFGFPRLGIVGTGLASTLVYWIMFLSMLFVSSRHPHFKSFNALSRIAKPDGEYLRKLVHLGWPIGVSYFVEAGLFMLTALLMGLLGNVSLAAHQVAIQCAAYTFMVPLGIGLATSVRVGHAMGRQDNEAARLSGRVGIGMATTFMLVAALVFWIFPESIVGIFLDGSIPQNREVVALAVQLLYVAAIFQVFDGVQVTAAGALRGLKDTRIPMVIALVSYWILGLGVGIVLGFRFEQGAQGLWIGLVVGLAAAAVLMTYRFFSHVGRAERLL